MGYLLKQKTITSIQNSDYVDLGLPSGLLWARCNIGAEEPTEYGDYFMWGSTEPDNLCNWKHCPFNNGLDIYNERYFKSVQDKVCSNDILVPEYDVATRIWGDGCRMPTAKEYKELIDNTRQEWVEKYKGSDANGMLFTPKNGEAAKANGVELFIPASGYRSGSGRGRLGSCANLWSSSLIQSSSSCAMYIYFDNYNCFMAYDLRCYGFCLRSVKET